MAGLTSLRVSIIFLCFVVIISTATAAKKSKKRQEKTSADVISVDQDIEPKTSEETGPNVEEIKSTKKAKKLKRKLKKNKKNKKLKALKEEEESNSLSEEDDPENGELKLHPDNILKALKKQGKKVKKFFKKNTKGKKDDAPDEGLNLDDIDIGNIDIDKDQLHKVGKYIHEWFSPSEGGDNENTDEQGGMWDRMLNYWKDSDETEGEDEEASQDESISIDREESAESNRDENKGNKRKERRRKLKEKYAENKSESEEASELDLNESEEALSAAYSYLQQWLFESVEDDTNDDDNDDDDSIDRIGILKSWLRKKMTGEDSAYEDALIDQWIEAKEATGHHQDLVDGVKFVKNYFDGDDADQDRTLLSLLNEAKELTGEDSLRDAIKMLEELYD